MLEFISPASIVGDTISMSQKIVRTLFSAKDFQLWSERIIDIGLQWSEITLKCGKVLCN